MLSIHRSVRISDYPNKNYVFLLSQAPMDTDTKPVNNPNYKYQLFESKGMLIFSHLVEHVI